MLRYLLPVVIFCVMLSATSRAGLMFDEPIELNPKPEDEEVEKTFTFKNDSKQPVAVLGLESTCSCLEATLDKAVYAPGERGTGRARFKVSSFVGRHEKTLHIKTNDPQEPEKVVTFILDVPVVVDIEPKLLQWVVGTEPEEKEFVIKIVGEEPMRITNVTPTRQNVKTETTEITPGREYRLKVRPTTTKDVTIGALKIETDSKIPKYARQMAFFSIVRPEQAEKKAAAAAKMQP